MAKGCCGSGSGTCSCQIVGVGRIEIEGSGLPTDPFLVSIEAERTSVVNDTFVTTAGGAGTTADPWTVETTFNASSAKLDHVPDVNAPNPTNGQVLTWDGPTSAWVPRAATVAPAGAVLHDTSLDGDGSAGTPLAVLPSPTRMLGTFPTGFGLTDTGLASITRRFVDSAARSAAISTPMLNQLTMLDTEPGVIDYWTGAAWSVLPNQTVWEVPTGAMLELSGAYTDGLPVTVMILQVNGTTDGAGNFDVLGTPMLAGRSGVLSCVFTEEGSTPWKAMLNAVNNKIVGTAYRVTDGSVLAGSPVRGTVQTILY